MNRVFYKYLDLFVVVFIDNILVYSANHLEHEEHLKTVLKVLRENKLFVKLKKMSFCWKKCHSWDIWFPMTELQLIQRRLRP
jgi:hypothetical protein